MAQIAEIASARASAPTLLQRIVLAHGWTRRAIAFCAGAAGALALAPFDFIPAMFAPLTVAVWLIDGAADGEDAPRFALAPILSAAGAGWWLGFGYFVAGLWWMGAAMLVEADQFAWALPLAVFGLPAVLALFPAARFRARAPLVVARRRRASSRSPPDSAPRSGCAAICSPAFPGTISAWRSQAPGQWRRRPRSSACTGSTSSRS